jgi:LmbE family N-acetylglucosaminyl deacetylase
MRVLAVSAHPDDETLGCGGTLLKHRAQGDEVCWVVATQAHEPHWPADQVERKRLEISAVAEAYGMARVFRLGYPSMGLDTVPLTELITALGDVIAKVRPHTVYLVHHGDVHTDHRALFDAAAAALKPFHMSRFDIHRILCYETLSSTDAAPAQLHRAFLPVVFSDISPYLERKLEIMSLFGTEQQDSLLPRGASAVRALARLRGATVGVEYAEGFTLFREIVS